MKSGLGSSFKECDMQGCRGDSGESLERLHVGYECAAMSAAAAGEGAFYPVLEPGAFMTRWLVCGPFPVSEAGAGAVEEKVQLQAFYRDYLAQHGGEAKIEPNEQMVHQYNGKEYKWQKLAGEGPALDLTEVFGSKDYVVAYAWAEFDMPEARRGLLGVASDDAVKVWLNGEQMHENWVSRPVRPDDDLLVVRFKAGRNRILLKVQNKRESWGFACRLLDGKTLAEKLLTAVAPGRVEHGADVPDPGRGREYEGQVRLHRVAHRPDAGAKGDCGAAAAEGGRPECPHAGERDAGSLLGHAVGRPQRELPDDGIRRGVR